MPFTPLAELGSFGDGVAQHVTGRDLGQPIAGSKALGLGSLPGPRRAQENDDHQEYRRALMRPPFKKPS